MNEISAADVDGVSANINRSTEETRIIRKENTIETDSMASSDGILMINVQHLSTTAGVFLPFSPEDKLTKQTRVSLDYSTDYFHAIAFFINDSLEVPLCQYYIYSNTDGIYCRAIYEDSTLSEILVCDNEGAELIDPADKVLGMTGIANTVLDLEVGWNLQLQDVFSELLG